MIKLILLIFSIVFACQVNAATKKHIPLKELLDLDIQVPKGKFVRLIFPFVLDNPRLNPKINLQINNTKGFEVSTKDQFRGQNFLLIKSLGGTAQIMLSVSGYNITLNLTTADSNIRNYIFEMNKQDRHNLITKEIEIIKQKYMDDLESAKLEMEKELVKKAVVKFAELTEESPSITYIKEDIASFSNSMEASLYLEQIEAYDDQIFVLRYEVDVVGNQTYISDGAVIEGKTKCRNTGIYKCLFVTNDPAVFSKDEFTISIATKNNKFAFTY